MRARPKRKRLFRKPDNPTPDDPKQARRAGMDILARREHSARELGDKLRRKGFSAPCVEEAVAGLIEDGLQSDERYAESIVAVRVAQGKGPLHILHGLKKCGVASGLAEAALAAANVDWAERAVQVRAKRFGHAPVTEPRELARQMRFLLQRGFSAEQARAAVNDDLDF